jgi:hypothetical protein
LNFTGFLPLGFSSLLTLLHLYEGISRFSIITKR